MKRTSTIERLQQLAPWHHAVRLPDGTMTHDGNPPDSTRFITVIDPWHMEPTFEQLFGGGGLSGRSFLDVGCNGGGYGLLAHSMGARRVVGFDARQHWIDQAEYLRTSFDIDESLMSFETMHLHDVAELEERFDFTMFSGVFYHLPDPIRAMELLAGITDHAMLINTATAVGAPDDTLTVKFESVEPLMSGVDGLSWLPGGPTVITKIAAAFGFPHHRVLFNNDEQRGDTRDSASSSIGRCAVVVARDESTLP